MSTNKFPLNCLIIDDDSGDIEIIRRKLAKACRYAITIIPCQRLEDLSAIPADTKIDIILLDYQLGPITGLEALSDLRGKGFGQPVIMLTGQGNELIAVEAMKGGIADYLVKDDATWQILEKAIANALKKLELQAEIDKQQQLILRQATTDSLTGLNNRGYCLQRIEEARQRAARYNHPFSLLMFDLDHFKHINDTYGHPAGDKVLSRTGQIIASVLRETDIAGRYGGEEFVVALDNTDLDGAINLAERLRQAMAHEAFQLEASLTVPVTCSIGVSCLDRDREITDIETLLAATDEALYLAKNRGRNQVAVNPRHEHLQSEVQVKCQCPECMVRKGRVLIVDDEPVSLSVLRNMLATSVDVVHEASSGVNALAILGHEQVDILITDLVMPGMDGLELMRRARSLIPDLQVIIVTASESRENVLIAMRLGAVNYLNKPIRTEELSIAVHQGMERVKLLRQRKQQEMLFETSKKSLIWLMKAVNNPVLVIDDHGLCQFTNQAAERVFGVPSGLYTKWRFGSLLRTQGSESICILPHGQWRGRLVTTMHISRTIWEETEVSVVVFDELNVDSVQDKPTKAFP